MDALSRFWCELIQFKYTIDDREEHDRYDLERALNPTTERPPGEDAVRRVMWLDTPPEHHWSQPPGGYLAEFLFEEGFRGNDGTEQLPRLDNLARLAIEDSTIADRQKWIRRALIAINEFVHYHGQVAVRENCECPRCQRTVESCDYGKVRERWDRVLARLGFYVLPEYRSYEGWQDIEDRQPGTNTTMATSANGQHVPKNEAAVLRALNKNQPVPMTNAEIETSLRDIKPVLCERTISGVVNKLIEKRLAVRPTPKGGAVLTAAGLEIAAAILPIVAP